MPSPLPFQDLRVLLVDDSKTIRRSGQNLLQREGCTVIVAEDGFDALGLVIEHEPDVVLVDIMMPRLDGFQTCALIKNNPRFRDTPVIMLSSKDGLFDRARAQAVGANHYLTKPFTREELIEALRSARGV